MKRAFAKYLFSVLFLLLGTVLSSYANSVPESNLKTSSEIRIDNASFGTAQLHQSTPSSQLELEKILIEETESEDFENHSDADQFSKLFTSNLFTAAFYMLAWEYAIGKNETCQPCRKQSTHHTLKRFIQLEVFRI
ncbi:MAG: hypothetical protein ABGW97_07630 [Christiangramia sp.]|uniref:hypothetical protein n=1 Tax=Christiangramia sp. TaxID=1931228 RepID=UPI003241DE5A